MYVKILYMYVNYVYNNTKDDDINGCYCCKFTWSSKKLTVKNESANRNHKLNALQSVKNMEEYMVKIPLVEVKSSIKNCLTQNKAKKMEYRNKTIARTNNNMIDLIQ